VNVMEAIINLFVITRRHFLQEDGFNRAHCSGKPDPLADIPLDGDVILVVGQRNVRLRVHSQFLGRASKVFGAMFEPRWREGESLSRQYPARGRC
jgi:hypothetical protein